MDNVSNFAISAVATSPTPATSGTSLMVTIGDGAKFPVTGPGSVTIWPAGALPSTTNAEICRWTRSGDTLTLTRAQEGSTARAIVVGDQVAQTVTAGLLAQIDTGAFNVKAYGAKGDGTTDDTAAIQSAITAAGVNGGTVTGPAATYYLGTLTAGGGVTGAAQHYILKIPSNVTLSFRGSTFITAVLPSGASGGYVAFLQNASLTAGNTNIRLIGGTWMCPAPTYSTSTHNLIAWSAVCDFHGVSNSYIDPTVTMVNGGWGFWPIDGQWNTATALASGLSDNNRVSCTVNNGTGSCTFFQSTNCVFDGYIKGAWDDALLIGSAGSGHYIGGHIDATPVVSGNGASTAAVYLDNDGACGTTPESMHDITIRPSLIIGPSGMGSGVMACVATAGSNRGIHIDTIGTNGVTGVYIATATLIEDLQIRGSYYRNTQEGVVVNQTGAGSVDVDIDAEVWDNGSATIYQAGFDFYVGSGGTLAGRVRGRSFDSGSSIQLYSVRICQDTGGTLKMDFLGVSMPLPNSVYGPGLWGSSTLHNCRGFNPKGPQTPPSVPGTIVSLTNPFPFDCTVFVTAGAAATTVAIGGTTALVLAISAQGSFRVPAGQTITLTYASGTPAWTWFGD